MSAVLESSKFWCLPIVAGGVAPAPIPLAAAEAVALGEMGTPETLFAATAAADRG